MPQLNKVQTQLCACVLRVNNVARKISVASVGGSHYDLVWYLASYAGATKFSKSTNVHQLQTQYYVDMYNRHTTIMLLFTLAN